MADRTIQNKNLKPMRPGETLNPGGKPVNARNRITNRFLNALADDFESHGEQAIRDARDKDPARYVSIVAGLLPKEFVIERPEQGLSDEELANAIALLRDLLSRGGSASEDAGAGGEAAQGPALH